MKTTMEAENYLFCQSHLIVPYISWFCIGFFYHILAVMGRWEDFWFHSQLRGKQLSGIEAKAKSDER